MLSEEARRLASLQKRRELKAAGTPTSTPHHNSPPGEISDVSLVLDAGIELRTKKRRTGFMDYNAEIPFEKRPALGFFDPSADDKFKASDQFVKRSLQQLEPEKRMDKEMEERKRDAKKQRLAKEKNLPAVMNEINAMNDPESTLRRSKLAMPAPQITDDELAEVARIGRGKNMATDGFILTK